MKGAKVFVNYRRRDAPGSAGRLHDDLARRFGTDEVFRDVAMAYGRDFVEEITSAAGTCHALLAVIGPRWLTLTGKDGRRRLDDPGDYVRLEIETKRHSGWEEVDAVQLLGPDGALWASGASASSSYGQGQKLEITLGAFQGWR